MADTEATEATEAVDATEAVGAGTPKPRRTPEEVAAELATARESLVGHVDAITEHLKPANIAHRSVAPLRRIFVSDEGKPNVRNIAITVSVVAVYVLYRVRR